MSAIDVTVAPLTMNDPPTPARAEEHKEKSSTTTEDSKGQIREPSKEAACSPTSDLVPASANVLRTLQERLQTCLENIEAQIPEGSESLVSSVREARLALEEANLLKMASVPPLENRRKRRVASQRKAKKAALKKESINASAVTCSNTPVSGTEKAEVTKDGAVLESRQRAKQPQRARSPPFQQLRLSARNIFYPDLMPVGPYRGGQPQLFGFHHPPPPPPRFPYDFSGMRPVPLHPHEEAYLRFGPQGSRRAKERQDLVKQEKDQAEIRDELRKAQTADQLQSAIEKAKHLSMDYEVAAATKQLDKLKTQA